MTGAGIRDAFVLKLFSEGMNEGGTASKPSRPLPDREGFFVGMLWTKNKEWMKE